MCWKNTLKKIGFSKGSVLHSFLNKCSLKLRSKQQDKQIYITFKVYLFGLPVFVSAFTHMYVGQPTSPHSTIFASMANAGKANGTKLGFH